MKDQSEYIQLLRTSIEDNVGYKLRTPKDFDTLSDAILEKTKQRVSSSTLKRLWGYRSDTTIPRPSTLDTLARFVGYDNFKAFRETNTDNESCEETNVPLSPNHQTEDKPLGKEYKPFSAPTAWLLYALLLLVVAGAAYFGLSKRQPTTPASSAFILKKGQTFATYQDYLTLFGIHATDTLWGQRLPHHPILSIWGPKYHHHHWHNYGDSALLMPTITERWEPDEGGADSTLIAMRNKDHYYSYRDLNELRITFMQGLTPDGDSLTFCGVYRMDLKNSNIHHVTWMRVAEEVDLSHLDYLEELRN